MASQKGNRSVSPLLSKGSFFVLAGALLWSTGGLGVKWLTGNLDYSPWLVSTFRSFFAALFFLAIAPKAVLQLPSRKNRRWFLIGSLCYAYVVTGFVVSTTWTSAANAIILQDTMPLFILFLGAWLLQEPIRKSDFLALGFGVLGIFFCVRQGLTLPSSGEGFSMQTWGDLLALSTALAFAITTVAMRKANQDTAGGGSAIGFLFAGNMLGAAVGGIFTFWFGATHSGGAVFELSGLFFVGVAVFIWLGFAQLGGGYFCVQRGLREIPAFQASLIMLAEPVLNPIWVALIVGEIPSSGTIIGVTLVLVAMAIGLRRG